MHIKLGTNAYGKNAINLSKVIRHAGYHEFRQISVDVLLQGDFEMAHTLGDNSKILPTDTQKNTVYALAKEHFNSSIEEFGIYLSGYFLSRNPQVTEARIHIVEHLWTRMSFNGAPHSHAFSGGGSEKRDTVVVKNTKGIKVTSGIKDLLILKTTDSAFEDFIKDEYTILKETNDRIMATQCEANWEYSSINIDFETSYQKIRNSLFKTFAYHKSLSVQHTLYAIGELILKENDLVKEISLIMPNKHHIPFNLEPFGIENKNEIFVATDEPYGYITGTVVREH